MENSQVYFCFCMNTVHRKFAELLYRPRFEIIRDASTSTSSSYARPLPITADRDDIGGPYTLGNEGAVAEVGLEFPPVELVGEPGGGKPVDSVMRDSDMERSRLCARLLNERGLELEICSFNLASRSESEPRFRASSVVRVREGIPDPYKKN